MKRNSANRIFTQMELFIFPLAIPAAVFPSSCVKEQEMERAKLLEDAKLLQEHWMPVFTFEQVHGISPHVILKGQLHC
jgi:hypothetical protein